MKSIKARVVNGRLVVNESTKFPEGTELDLTVADDGDDLSDEERPHSMKPSAPPGRAPKPAT